MKRTHILKRLLAVCLAVFTVITTIYQPDRTAWAETTTVQPGTTTGNEIQTEGTNSFGNLLNKELEEKLDEQKENAGYNVFSLEVTGTTVNVELEALEACTLVVGIYDEAGTTMLGSGTTDVPEKAESATVTVDIASMPTYFDVKAYLIDSETQAPLCQVFDCPTYTQEMQEFLKKSVNDFDADRVLNLDDSEDNNFAVFQEDVKYIEEQENANQVTTEDEANNTYVIENASEEIQALQPGDTTALEYEVGQVLIIKVASITMDGTTATIIGEDTNLEEVFEYMKIDTEAYTEDATVDPSNLEEGITYQGMSEAETQTIAVEDEMSADRFGGEYTFNKQELSFNINKKIKNEYTEVKVAGSIKLAIATKLKCFVTSSRKYLELTVDYSIKVSISVSGKINFKLPLVKLKFSPAPGVSLKLSPALEAEFSGTITLSAIVTGRVGGSVSIGSPCKNLSTAPKMETKLEIEGKIYIGLLMKPEISLISSKVIRAEIELRTGGEITLKQNMMDFSTGSTIHSCKKCLSGDISRVESITFSVTFLNLKSLTVKKKFEMRSKYTDCHYSIDYNEFQCRQCPHKGYLIQIQLIDKNGNRISNATITGAFLIRENGMVKRVSSVRTDANGKVSIYMTCGKQKIQAQSNGIIMDEIIYKLDSEEKIVLTLEYKVLVSSTIFPDENFRKYILRYIDTNGDGALSEGEIKNTRKIKLFNYRVSSLDGIKLFYALEELDCTNNDVCSLDVSKNTSLKILLCYNNKLRELDVSKNAALEILQCDSNQLSSLDVSKNLKLKELGCSDNLLSSLDVSRNVALEGLACWNNQLSKLDVSKNTLLNVLSCFGNQLNKLDVSKNASLEILDCSDNQLSKLDVSKNTVLKEFYCSDNQMRELDVSKNTALEQLGCYDNQMSELDVGKNTALERLECYGNNLSKLDVSRNTKLQYLDCDSTVKLVGWPRTTSSNTVSPDAINSMEKYDQDLAAELATEEETASESEPLTSPVTYTDLLPNSIYNFYVLKDKEEAISSDNLLYIIQITSDENGQATIPFAYNETYEAPQAKLVGMERLDIADAEVTLENLYYTGETQDAEPVVVYKGTTLESGKDYTITGEYQATEIGTYTIQIVGIGLYKGSLEQSYQILPVIVAGIGLSQSNLSMKKGETVTLTATITPENATNKAVTWTSSDAKIATVNSAGKVTSVSAGTATITCAAQDDSGVKATCKVTVTNPPTPVRPTVKVTKITLNKTTANVVKGKTLQLSATVIPTTATNKAVTWSSSNTKVATVNSVGKVTAVSAGTVTITCTAKDGSGVKATCKITVTTPKPPVKPTVKVTKLTLNKKSATLSPEETLTLKATVTPTNATNKAVVWKSSNTKIATVSSTGKVTAKAAGTVTITCTAKDGSGKKATCKITVYNSTQAYVARIYTKALGRAAEPAGLNYWVSEINSKRRTPVQVAEEFFFAPEFTNKELSNTEYVKVLYRTFMGREYDQGGLDYWVGRLNRGESRKSVLESFAGCPEFQKIIKSFGL